MEDVLNNNIAANDLPDEFDAAQDARRPEGMVTSRRKAREVVLQALYQCDTLGDSSTECLTLFFEHFYPELLVENGDSIAPLPPVIAPVILPTVPDYGLFIRKLILGVLESLSVLDGTISKVSHHWSIERMARVDRNLLRLAVYEMLFCDEIPVNVTINEAIEIAKRFGGEESPGFINGILDTIAKKIEEISPAVANG
jgi:N utilization substance protein B